MSTTIVERTTGHGGRVGGRTAPSPIPADRMLRLPLRNPARRLIKRVSGSIAAVEAVGLRVELGLAGG